MRYGPFIVVAAVLVIVVGSYLAFRPEGFSPFSETPLQAMQRVAIADLPLFGTYNLVAKEQGFFTENGLMAQVRMYDSSASSVRALLGGTADIAVASDFGAVTSMFERPDVRIIAGLGKQDVLTMTVRTDRQIVTPADLKGKRIGVTLRTGGELFFGQFLIANDLERSEMTVVNLTPDQISAGLITGDLDAAVTAQPNTYNLEDRLKGAIEVWPVPEDNATHIMVLSTEEYIARHPQVIESYIRALAKADDFVRTNPEETKRLFRAKLGYSDAFVRYDWPKLEFSLSLKQNLLIALEHAARYAIGAKLTNATVVPNYLDLISFTALEKIRPEAIEIIHSKAK